jgi:hypothetical protein
VAEYLHWIRSDAGQRIVGQLGYCPLPADLRTTGGEGKPSGD